MGHFPHARNWCATGTARKNALLVRSLRWDPSPAQGFPACLWVKRTATPGGRWTARPRRRSAPPPASGRCRTRRPSPPGEAARSAGGAPWRRWHPPARRAAAPTPGRRRGGAPYAPPPRGRWPPPGGARLGEGAGVALDLLVDDPVGGADRLGPGHLGLSLDEGQVVHVAHVEAV